MHRVVVTLLLVCWPLISLGQVFKHVDKDGNVTFTDQPPPDSVEVDINDPNLISAPPAGIYPSTEVAEEPVLSGPDYQVNISSPANETIIPRGPGNFSVSASLSPSLTGEHQLQLLIDGSPREEPQKSTTWNLTNVFRGTHNLQVAVIDEKGKQVATSEPVTVFVFRPSSNFR